MELGVFESKMLKDALIECWHDRMKHSNNERVKNQYQRLMDEIRHKTELNEQFTITINK